MRGSLNLRWVSSALVAGLAFAVVVVSSVFSPLGIGVRLLAGTLVVIGGNSNPHGNGMEQILGGDPFPGAGVPNTTGLPVGELGHGYIDPTNADSPYFGYGFDRISWPSQIPLSTGWDGHTSFDQSQEQGVTNLGIGLDDAIATGGPVVVGYSSGANVVVRKMRELQESGAPGTDQIEFLLIAGMNRPNGGLGQRFRGFFLPFFGVPFDGGNPTDTPYHTTDVSWQYDTISDFPAYPLNAVAVLNALIGFTLHINYYPADINGPRAFPDTTVGNVTYVTLKSPGRLPLLMPLERLGMPKQLLDLVEPALTVLVELGYERGISPGVPVAAGLLPSPSRLLALPFDLLKAVGVGIQHALNPAWDKQTTDATTTQLTTQPESAAAVTALRTTGDADAERTVHDTADSVEPTSSHEADPQPVTPAEPDTEPARDAPTDDTVAEDTADTAHVETDNKADDADTEKGTDKDSVKDADESTTKDTQKDTEKDKPGVSVTGAVADKDSPSRATTGDAGTGNADKAAA